MEWVDDGYPNDYEEEDCRIPDQDYYIDELRGDDVNDINDDSDLENYILTVFHVFTVLF